MEFNREKAYNVHEHNHIEKTDETLTDRLSQLAEINKDWQGEERRLQIQSEMSIIAFELSERFRETKGQQIEESWAGRNEMIERL